MNLFGAWKKLLLFGIVGAVGCLAGWAVGEVYLSVAREVAESAGASQGPSLISNAATHSEPPPFVNSDFKTRLDKWGGKSGDVQISLIWFNKNDLDLHCVDPSGFDIGYQHKIAPSKGQLNVDKNAGCRDSPTDPLTAEPVENIYWPEGQAPRALPGLRRLLRPVCSRHR